MDLINNGTKTTDTKKHANDSAGFKILIWDTNDITIEIYYKKNQAYS